MSATCSYSNMAKIKKKLPTQVDDVISAELPNPKEDPVLYETIRKHMIHGPCGELNRDSLCTKDVKCTKSYSHEMIIKTQTGNDGYPLYMQKKAR
ncbi:hypothetical protein EVAR_65694_1 [Eumeta japonica]|uniref:Uncharacterized protein n=1 Tax=Eumeta variegata TaxID=151549 RepID=A0A4C1ZBA8_EUMVA|nr:hypothetical protein EVAR_65694_1 [Eumeta japonica]